MDGQTVHGEILCKKTASRGREKTREKERESERGRETACGRSVGDFR